MAEEQGHPVVQKKPVLSGGSRHRQPEPCAVRPHGPKQSLSCKQLPPGTKGTGENNDFSSAPPSSGTPESHGRPEMLWRQDNRRPGNAFRPFITADFVLCSLTDSGQEGGVQQGMKGTRRNRRQYLACSYCKRGNNINSSPHRQLERKREERLAMTSAVKYLTGALTWSEYTGAVLLAPRLRKREAQSQQETALLW